MMHNTHWFKYSTPCGPLQPTRWTAGGLSLAASRSTAGATKWGTAVRTDAVEGKGGGGGCMYGGWINTRMLGSDPARRRGGRGGGGVERRVRIPDLESGIRENKTIENLRLLL